MEMRTRQTVWLTPNSEPGVPVVCLILLQYASSLCTSNSSSVLSRVGSGSSLPTNNTKGRLRWGVWYVPVHWRVPESRKFWWVCRFCIERERQFRIVLCFLSGIVVTCNRYDVSCTFTRYVACVPQTAASCAGHTSRSSALSPLCVSRFRKGSRCSQQSPYFLRISFHIGRRRLRQKFNRFFVCSSRTWGRHRPNDSHLHLLLEFSSKRHLRSRSPLVCVIYRTRAPQLEASIVRVVL